MPLLHKYTTNYFEQILEATAQEKEAEQPLTSHFHYHPNKTCGTRKTCWRGKDGLISVGRPARSYSHQFCVDSECSLEGLPRAMDDRDGWRERIREIHAVSMTWWGLEFASINRLFKLISKYSKPEKYDVRLVFVEFLRYNEKVGSCRSTDFGLN